MNNQKFVHVKAIWDSQAKVWVATSNDVPGLVTEAPDSENLVRKLKIMIPELLQANGLMNQYNDPEIPFNLLCERSETASCQT